MSKKHDVSKPYFPGFTRKSVTFSIDDGNLEMDKKFISIVAPYGIKGTFNLCANRITPENAQYHRTLYRGFEIANHCSYHPFCWGEEYRASVVNEKFDPETANEECIYPCEKPEGLYTVHRPNGWRRGAFVEDYLRFAEEGQKGLEAVFGEGNVHGFVWPFGKQASEECFAGLVAQGYPHIRKTGNVLDSTGYAIPEDFMNWSYNASHLTVKTQVPVYESYPDDGELKFFCIGVHSIDFERDNNFCDLEYFARTFGNQPNAYYTAGVHDIFHYSECVKRLIVTDTTIENPTDRDIYVKVDGKCVIVRAGTTYDMDTGYLVID